MSQRWRRAVKEDAGCLHNYCNPLVWGWEVKILSKDSSGYARCLGHIKTIAKESVCWLFRPVGNELLLQNCPWPLKGAGVSRTQGDPEPLVPEISMGPEAETLKPDKRVNMWRGWETPNLGFIHYIFRYRKEAGSKVVSNAINPYKLHGSQWVLFQIYAGLSQYVCYCI